MLPRNPTGSNQHGDVLKDDNPTLVAALEGYHREKLTNNDTIAKRLQADFGISMSGSTVKRRRKALGLTGSGATTKTMSTTDINQLVVDELEKDPAKRQGVCGIQNKIAFNTGTHLTRDAVSESMHLFDPEGFDTREPTSKKIFRVPKFPVGIHEKWAGDGHDKLYGIGFPIWGVVDDATAKWLGGWVVPSNRMGKIIGYLFLCLIEEYGGIPIQFTTDCGSETTQLFGLISALREIFHPDFDINEVPAHVYLRSVHNISIERSWLRLRLDFGDNMVLIFHTGAERGIYKVQDPNHVDLCQWLWPKLLNQELQTFMKFRNGITMRKDNTKAGPSGMSPNQAFSIPEDWGGKNCLLPVNVSVIREIKEIMGGSELLEFVSPEFRERSQAAFDSLEIVLTPGNVWDIFEALLPLVFVDDDVN